MITKVKVDTDGCLVQGLGVQWLGVQWLDVQWLGVQWLGVQWLDVQGLGVQWLGVQWLGVQWLGVQWLGVQWLDVQWLGVQRLGVQWLGVQWLGVQWLVSATGMGDPGIIPHSSHTSDNFTCCHTDIEAADQTFYLTQSQYTDTGPTSPSADPITRQAYGRLANGVPILKSLKWLNPEKSCRKQDSNLGSSAVEGDVK